MSRKCVFEWEIEEERFTQGSTDETAADSERHRTKTPKFRALKVDCSPSADIFTILYNSFQPDKTLSNRGRPSCFLAPLNSSKKTLCLSYTLHPPIDSLFAPLRCSHPLPPPLPPCCQLISAALSIFLSQQVTNSSLEAGPPSLDAMNLF